MSANNKELAGGCRCGKVRFRLDAAPIITHACHCRHCQRASGSAFCTNTMIETEHVTVVEGATRSVDGPRGTKEVRCGGCASVLWTHIADLGDAIAIVGVGMLDEGERLEPEAHYFVRSKHPWNSLPAGVPTFEELGDPGKPEMGARIGAVLARSGGPRPRAG